MGDGSQQLRWLANVALCRYDSNNGIHLGKHAFHRCFFVCNSLASGFPKGMRVESGQSLNLNHSIKESLKNEDQVWVLLSKGERERRSAVCSHRAADEEDPSLSHLSAMQKDKEDKKGAGAGSAGAAGAKPESKAEVKADGKRS